MQSSRWQTNMHRMMHMPQADVSFGRNAVVQWLVIAIVIVNLTTTAGLGIFVHPGDDFLKLQYNVYFGTSLHASWWGVYMLPLVGLLFLGIGLILGYILYNITERIAAYIILLGVLFAHIALIVAAVSVILNNF